MGQSAVSGYAGAIYSGLTTVELTRVVGRIVLPDTALSGLYQVAAQPISKFELLQLVADRYDWPGVLTMDSDFRCDRSLIGSR